MITRSASRWTTGLLLVAVLFPAPIVGLADTMPLSPLPPGAKMPVARSRPEPGYPKAMYDSRLGGQVLVEFIVTTEGNVSNPVVVRSNNPFFERAALDAILQWKFKPGEVNGRKVNVRAQQLIKFELDTGDSSSPLWVVHKNKDKRAGELPPEFQWTKAPEAIATSYPVYPLAALQANQEGVVRIGFVVNPQGKVVLPQVVEAATPEMGLATLAMIDTWAFTPPKKKDGTACYAGISMTFKFLTKDGRGDVPVNDEMRRILKQLQETPDPIVPAAELDAPLKPLSRRPPVYPTTLLAGGQQGEALVEFFIDRHGDVQLPRIVSSTAPEFGYAAVQAIATWRYEVPKKGGKPVTTRAKIPLNFELHAHAADKLAAGEK
jgi:TonB family protein